MHCKMKPCVSPTIPRIGSLIRILNIKWRLSEACAFVKTKFIRPCLDWNLRLHEQGGGGHTLDLISMISMVNCDPLFLLLVLNRKF